MRTIDELDNEIDYLKNTIACLKGENAALKAELAQQTHNSAMVSASQISAAANDWDDGHHNRAAINGFIAGAEWMRQKLHQ